MRVVLILAVALVAFVVTPVAMAGGGCAGSGAMCASACSPSCGTEASARQEPLLGPGGACSVYPRRELYARLFGCSFNDAGGVYGCHLVGDHLAGKQVTLLPARATARRLNELPLTELRQVYPFYIHALYGGAPGL